MCTQAVSTHAANFYITHLCMTGLTTETILGIGIPDGQDDLEAIHLRRRTKQPVGSCNSVIPKAGLSQRPDTGHIGWILETA